MSGAALDAPTGLVPYETSVPTFEIDTHAARLARMRQGVLTAARLVSEGGQFSSGRAWAYMVTLTYREGCEWEARHLSDMLKYWRKWFHARKVVRWAYVWVAELTKRGRLHYHILFFVPKGITLPFADKRGWWPHGLTSTERARHPVSYLAKYTSKGDTGLGYPKGARIHGTGGLEEGAMNERRWWMFARWVREKCAVKDLPHRCPGGGIVLRTTGEIFESPYIVVGIARGHVRVALRAHSILGSVSRPQAQPC